MVAWQDDRRRPEVQNPFEKGAGGSVLVPVCGVPTSITVAEPSATLTPGSVNACEGLTDVVLQLATIARARVAVLPCCHNAGVSDAGALSGWLDDALAIDVVRARRLASQGYHIWTQRIPQDITPKNRLLIGEPDDVPVSRYTRHPKPPRAPSPGKAPRSSLTLPRVRT